MTPRWLNTKESPLLSRHQPRPELASAVPRRITHRAPTRGHRAGQITQHPQCGASGLQTEGRARPGPRRQSADPVHSAERTREALPVDETPVPGPAATGEGLPGAICGCTREHSSTPVLPSNHHDPPVAARPGLIFLPGSHGHASWTSAAGVHLGQLGGPMSWPCSKVAHSRNGAPALLLSSTSATSAIWIA